MHILYTTRLGKSRALRWDWYAPKIIKRCLNRRQLKWPGEIWAKETVRNCLYCTRCLWCAGSRCMLNILVPVWMANSTAAKLASTTRERRSWSWSWASNHGEKWEEKTTKDDMLWFESKRQYQGEWCKVFLKCDWAFWAFWNVPLCTLWLCCSIAVVTGMSSATE